MTDKKAPRARSAPAKDPRDGGADKAPAAVTSNPLAPPGSSPEDHEAMATSTSGDVPRRERKKVVDLVSATVPKAFHLTDDRGVRHSYEQGVQDMPRDHAEHWYAKAHGVELNED